MIINIDVDGVLRDFMTSSIETYKRHYDKNCKIVHDDIKEYQYRNKLPLIEVNYMNFFYYFPKEIYIDAEPYPKVLDELEMLFKIPNNIINIVTKQPRGLEKYTLKWLENNNVFYTNLFFAQDKNLVRGDVLIDDYIGNLENYKQGIPVCMDRPWNQDWKGERIKSLKEVLKYDIHNRTGN